MHILMTSLCGGKRLSLSAAVVAALLTAPSAFADNAPQIKIGSETLVGVSSPGLAKFMGVRYAQAPTGELEVETARAGSCGIWNGGCNKARRRMSPRQEPLGNTLLR